MAKETTPKQVLERNYNIPLRKEYQKVPRWKRTPKAVRATKQFLAKHMKSGEIRLGAALNEKLWQHGMKNPPHHVKVKVTKDDQGLVKAELFGAKEKKESKEELKKKEEREEKKIEQKKEEIKEQEEQILGEQLEGETSEEKIKEEKEFVKEEKEEVKAQSSKATSASATPSELEEEKKE